MDAERIAEIRERLGYATPGPWEATTNEASMDGRPNYRIGPPRAPMAFNARMSGGDARLIAHAPTDLADLLAEVERLQAPTFPNERNAVTPSPALMAENLRVIKAELAQPWRPGPDAS